MKVGLALPHYDTSYSGRPASWESVLQVARLAEQAGFDSVWMSDHLFLDWSKYGGPAERVASLECLTTLSALAGATDRVRLGSLAICNDLRNPGLVAKMAATIDRLSGGRLDIGLGAGWYEPEYEVAGIEFDSAATRIRRAGEAAEIISRLLTGEELRYEGRFYRLDGAICRPLGIQDPRPPIFLGGKGDLLIKTAIRSSDGWNYSWLGDFEGYRERVAYARSACEELGREWATFRRSVGAYVLAGTDDNDARRRYDRLVERTPPGVLQAKGGGAGVSWEEFRSTRVAGTADEVLERLAPLAELGVEEVVMALGALPFQVADDEDVVLVGEEIVPALHRLVHQPMGS